jgi:hypothetical protein
MSKLHHIGSDWFFPIMMWLITIVCAKGVIQSTIQKRNTPMPENTKVPSEAS